MQICCQEVGVKFNLSRDVSLSCSVLFVLLMLYHISPILVYLCKSGGNYYNICPLSISNASRNPHI